MNLNALVNLLNTLYPSQMIKKASQDRIHDAKHSWITPTKKYMEEPIVLHMFSMDFGDMDNPRPSFTTTKEELHQIDLASRQNKENYKEANQPKSTIIYSNRQFQNEQSHNETWKSHVKTFAQTVLNNSDDVYTVLPNTMDNGSTRKLLTKSMVKLTVMSVIYKKAFLNHLEAKKQIKQYMRYSLYSLDTFTQMMKKHAHGQKLVELKQIIDDFYKEPKEVKC